MSTILDALRKAQNENSPKQQPDNKGVVGSDALLAPHHSRSALRTNQRAIIIGCAGALLFGITAWLLYGPSHKNRATQAATEKRTQPAVAVITPPHQPSPQPKPQIQTMQDVAAKPAQQRVNREDDEHKSATKQTAPPARKTAPAAIQGTPEGVKLAGIAWHDTRKLRRVVLNDALVSEGEMVAGVKVVEIRQHSVKVEKAGSLYEVSLP